jgi:hypothetical protein
MNENADARTSPVPNKGTQFITGMLRHRTEIQDAAIIDAGGINLDADSQLWYFRPTQAL